jgi:hypothetical protein
MTQFMAVLARNRRGFTAKPKGDRRGCIRRSGAHPIEVVYQALVGRPPETVRDAADIVFGSERKQRLAVAAGDAPSLLYIYQRAFSAISRGEGEHEARKVETEWQAILSVRGQMLKVLGIKDPLTGSDRLPSSLMMKSRKEEE